MTIPSATSPTLLGPVRLPAAPPVARAVAPRQRRRRAPAVVLLVLGTLLAVGPMACGLFAKAASGQQLIDAFEPHLTPDALDRYDADLATLRNGAAAIDGVYQTQNVPPGRFPGIDEYRKKAPAIDGRGTELLGRIRAAEPDYHRVAGIGGFDRLPFLVVASGFAMIYSAGVLVRGRGQRAGAVLLALTASIALAGVPFASDLTSGSRAGERLQHALAPIMTAATVRQEQEDFVVLVHAAGELDTGFRDVPRARSAARAIDALVRAWPRVSSDLAGLVGAINDNLENDRALADLDGLTRPVVPGLVAMPWLLVGAGAVGALAASSLLLPRKKERR